MTNSIILSAFFSCSHTTMSLFDWYREPEGSGLSTDTDQFIGPVTQTGGYYSNESYIGDILFEFNEEESDELSIGFNGIHIRTSRQVPSDNVSEDSRLEMPQRLLAQPPCRAQTCTDAESTFPIRECRMWHGIILGDMLNMVTQLEDTPPQSKF